MIPHALEKLILQGKAVYNTVVIGGGEKCILNVAKDRYIVIISLHFQNAFKNDGFTINDADLALLVKRFNTQLKVFSSKSMNTFLFRESFTLTESATALKYYAIPQGSTILETYLIHQSDVSFTFSSAGILKPDITAISKPQQIAFPPPVDYGSDGQVGALAVRISAQVSDSTTSKDYVTVAGGLYTRTTPNDAAPNELIFPVDSINKYTDINQPFSYPILNVGYVEVFGNPVNLQGTK